MTTPGNLTFFFFIYKVTAKVNWMYFKTAFTLFIVKISKATLILYKMQM